LLAIAVTLPPPTTNISLPASILRLNLPAFLAPAKTRDEHRTDQYSINDLSRSPSLGTHHSFGTQETFLVV
jgi:hypothetical protein